MILLSIALILLIVLLFSFSFFLVDGIFGGLDFTTGEVVAEQVTGIIKERHLEKGFFYDLGSCRGGFAIKIAKTFPQLCVYGIDDSRFRNLLARLRSTFLKNLRFDKENIFSTNVSQADIVYLYLPQELMPDLQTKLQKELKPGALIISYSVSFPNWTPAQSYILKQNNPAPKKLFVYEKQ